MDGSIMNTSKIHIKLIPLFRTGQITDEKYINISKQKLNFYCDN